MAVWIVLLGSAFGYLIWLSWFDTRHHRPWVAMSAAYLAAAYLGVIVVLIVSPWIQLPVWLTTGVAVLVEVLVRSLHRVDKLGDIAPLRPQYPVENP
jgi:hypothetical protein